MNKKKSFLISFVSPGGRGLSGGALRFKSIDGAQWYDHESSMWVNINQMVVVFAKTKRNVYAFIII